MVAAHSSARGSRLGSSVRGLRTRGPLCSWFRAVHWQPMTCDFRPLAEEARAALSSGGRCDSLLSLHGVQTRRSI